jgi:hypothetical protein
VRALKRHIDSGEEQIVEADDAEIAAIVRAGEGFLSREQYAELLAVGGTIFSGDFVYFGGR